VVGARCFLKIRFEFEPCCLLEPPLVAKQVKQRFFERLEHLLQFAAQTILVNKRWGKDLRGLSGRNRLSPYRKNVEKELSDHPSPRGERSSPRRVLSSDELARQATCYRLP
jgi:hypothetical protein